MKREDIIRILQQHNVFLTEQEIDTIPEAGIDPATRIHLDAIKY